MFLPSSPFFAVFVTLRPKRELYLLRFGETPQCASCPLKTASAALPRMPRRDTGLTVGGFVALGAHYPLCRALGSLGSTCPYKGFIQPQIGQVGTLAPIPWRLGLSDHSAFRARTASPSCAAQGCTRSADCLRSNISAPPRNGVQRASKYKRPEHPDHVSAVLSHAIDPKSSSQ